MTTRKALDLNGAHTSKPSKFQRQPDPGRILKASACIYSTPIRGDSSAVRYKKTFFFFYYIRGRVVKPGQRSLTNNEVTASFSQWGAQVLTLGLAKRLMEMIGGGGGKEDIVGITGYLVS